MSKNAADSVVPLRNEKAIATAAAYVESQIEALLELQMASEESKPLIDSLLAMIRSIGYGQSETTLVKNFDRLVEVLSTTYAAPASAIAPTQTPISLKEIERELARRKQLDERARRIQEILLTERDEKERLLAGIAEQVKSKCADDKMVKEKAKLETDLASLRKTCDRLTATIGDNMKKVSVLISHKAAVALVEQGLPKGIIGEKVDFC